MSKAIDDGAGRRGRPVLPLVVGLASRTRMVEVVQEKSLGLRRPAGLQLELLGSRPWPRMVFPMVTFSRVGNLFCMR